MKRKKEFFGVLISVLVCVFLVCLAVYATSTIGDDITVGDDLVVTSGATIGTGSTANNFTILDENTLLIEGILEVDGAAYFDSTASISGTLTVDGAVSFESTASVSSTLEALAVKTDTLSNSTGTLTINAFTLGGTIEGDTNDIISLDLLAASNASVSTKFEVGSDKFTVIGSSGNTDIQGTLDVTGNFAGTTASFSANVDLGDDVTADVVSANSIFRVGEISSTSLPTCAAGYDNGLLYLSDSDDCAAAGGASGDGVLCICDGDAGAWDVVINN